MNEPLLRTMSGQIVTRIRDKILSGDYAPGSALLQDSIAAEFGVSKIPVREALVRLRASSNDGCGISYSVSFEFFSSSSARCNRRKR